MFKQQGKEWPLLDDKTVFVYGIPKSLNRYSGIHKPRHAICVPIFKVHDPSRYITPTRKVGTVNLPGFALQAARILYQICPAGVAAFKHLSLLLAIVQPVLCTGGCIPDSDCYLLPLPCSCGPDLWAEPPVGQPRQGTAGLGLQWPAGGRSSQGLPMRS
jgi:hypothetical protein